MPVSRGEPLHDPLPTFYDNRVSGNRYGVNGHVNLMFDGPKLKTIYVDLSGHELLQEEWSVDGNGAVGLTSKQKLINDPEFHA